ncbi:GyrI-like domain-containing protein [Roseivirga sp. E12]|uniref:SRPBCC family protein n=1 Tax=Roseivirga sp. E12 TaxID=2819237 RepID=UPI001ABC532D|nr:GyrI-like domain-containing protein [Roseivirga sp. E12]MBO3697001.1 SRPBCC family protein [Roseivirga sp. E12]
MPKMNISRSVLVNAPIEKIFSTLNDFNHWSSWSPWLIMEPNTRVTVREDAKYYEWKGGRVGEGNMTVLNERENESIDYDLVFLKPWKSQAKVSFYMKQVGESIQVTWTMDSSLPFFMFWMKKQMEAFVGMDYERGLNMLKEYIEKGEIDSKLDFKGVSDFPHTHYVGVRTSCSMDKMGDHMMADYGKLEEYAKANEGVATGQAFSIYHKWDMVKQTAEYTACLGVNAKQSGLSGNLVAGEIPATKTYTLRHVGAYDHLGNAWSTLYAMQRGKEFKMAKGIHPFEMYVNSPQEVAPKDLITDIHFAVK